MTSTPKSRASLALTDDDFEEDDVSQRKEKDADVDNKEVPSPSVARQQRQQFLRQASAPTLEDLKPPLQHRWLHTTEAAAAATSTTTSSAGGAATGATSVGEQEASTSSSVTSIADRKSWNIFGQRDDRALERAYNSWKDEQRQRQRQSQGQRQGQGQVQGQDQAQSIDGDDLTLPKPDPDVDLPSWRVPVAEDRLFEVDLRTMRLSPVFWKGSANQVLRGTWFLDATKVTPLSMEVARELEELYLSIKPWLSSYADELRSSVALGSDAEDKLKAPLKTLRGSYAIFLGPHLARIYSDSVPTRITKTIFTAWSGSHGGGTLVARGFDNARRLLRTNSGEAVANKATAKMANEESAKDKRKGEGTSGDQSPVLVERSGQEAAGATLTAATSADFFRAFANKFGNWSGDTSPGKINKKGEAITADDAAKEQAKSDARGLESAGLVNDDAQIKGKEEGSSGSSSSTKPADVSLEARTASATAAALVDAESREDEEAFNRETERDNQPVELVLVWHGIGQKLADEWKSLDFTLAVSSLRSLAHKRANGASPADVGGGGIPALAAGRRVQFLPVMWRATLEDFEPPAMESEHEGEEHLNNRFSLEDIFADSIPLIRQLISGILLDIPLYLSQHKGEILRRVIRESNRIYRLFCQRNPNFLARGGQTSLVAHSLGAALATDILSKQPTHCRPFADLPDPGAELAFNVRNLYLVGSPVALFMWLNQAQLIARRGRRESAEAPADEALAREGRWGCLAVDRIFNVFSATDPIGTKMNSTVDARHSKDMSTITLARTTKSILRTLPGALNAPAIQTGKGFFASWARSGGGGGSSAASAAKEASAAAGEDAANEDRPDGAETDLLASSPTAGDGSPRSAKDAKWLKRLSASTRKKAGTYEQKRKEAMMGFRTGEWEGIVAPFASTTASSSDEKEVESEKTTRKDEKGTRSSAASSFDMADAETEWQSRDRAERRMKALNELGSIDFIIPPQPSLLTNQYMEFLWSHAGYWTDASFADFLLTTLMADSKQLSEAREKLSKEP